MDFWIKGEVKKLGIKMHGKQTVRINYKPKSMVTKAEIIKFAQKKSDALKDKGFKGKIAINIKWDHGWRGGYFEDVGAPIQLYELGDSDFNVKNEQTSFKKFQLYLIPE